MKNLTSKFALALLAMASTATVAHDGSEQASVISGIIHFMTEPDHLLASGVVAAGLIYFIRKLATKRS